LLAALGAPLATLGVLLAQLLGAAAHVGDAPTHPITSTLGTLLHHFGPVSHYWRHEMVSRNDITFYSVAAAEAYLVAKRVTE
jgi:hypothetical protein